MCETADCVDVFCGEPGVLGLEPELNQQVLEGSRALNKGCAHQGHLRHRMRLQGDVYRSSNCGWHGELEARKEARMQNNRKIELPEPNLHEFG